MFYDFKSKPQYSSVDDEADGELKLGSDYVPVKAERRSFNIIIGLLLLSVASTWALLFGSLMHWKYSPPTALTFNAPNLDGPSWVCQQPSTRREWRTLNEIEKTDYLTAVKCLATKPSKLQNKGTLYDDFPWVHKHTSTNSKPTVQPSTLSMLKDFTDTLIAHVSAPFLPWHRYYIHLYEKALKEDCSFDGVLPYALPLSLPFILQLTTYPVTGIGHKTGRASQTHPYGPTLAVMVWARPLLVTVAA
jgi:hypothetical protein